MNAELERKAARIGEAVTIARKGLKGDAGDLAERFLRGYYAHVPPEDVIAFRPERLAGAAGAHRAMGSVRQRGKPKIRVYNPSVSQHGWRISHTVIEIVTDDMPFLVDSVTSELNRRGLNVLLTLHPILRVRRDARGRMLDVLDTGVLGADDGVFNESFMHMQIAAIPKTLFREIERAIADVIGDVVAAVEGWQPMRLRLGELIDELESLPIGVSLDEISEVRDFLRWLYEDHFTFLGYREYTFSGTDDTAKVSINKGSGLGVLRNPDKIVFQELHELASLPPEVHDFVHRPDLLMVNKTNTLSTVHRPVHMDSVGIKRLDAQGKVVGERVFVGLFTASAYTRSLRDIPLLRRKMSRTFDRAGLPASSHDGKALLNILETYPRDELFQISEDTLLDIALGILHLQDRQRVALFLRKDDFERFISCLIYIPRDRYTTDLRMRMQAVLEDAFAGKVTSHSAQLGSTALARLHVIVETTPGAIPEFNVDVLEKKLIDTARSWSDSMLNVLIGCCDEQEGTRLFHRYQKAFPAGYRERYDVADSLEDILHVEETSQENRLNMNLYQDGDGADGRFRFKVYHPDQPLPLSDVLPILERLGLRVVDEIPYRVRPGNKDENGAPETVVMIHDFGLEAHGGAGVLKDVRQPFHDAFRRVWEGDMESDGFNALILKTGMSWRQVTFLRAMAKYLRQTGITFSQEYMERTLVNNSDIAVHIVAMFEARFKPQKAKDALARANRHGGQIRANILGTLELVSSADEDRILRRYVNLVDAMVRTNYFQIDADREARPYMSFKFSSADLEELPLPRPFREIFVYSPRVEGVHLRFGLVARGGLRWSDRREDFRTEVLGLVKAQQVKNAVIVPVGSKGGFFVKRPPVSGDREAQLAEGIACYKTFIRGLLDLTDNLDRQGKIIPPTQMMRYDGDDPYLVVAADKGTATFSDIANGVSEEYGFWLGDAFASGGSQGYDHKKMGITARGGWESVKRHFREMGIDCQKQAFTAIGVGDMSGDVFGNGMLLSPYTRLQAAFNHMHIFIDPNPDPKASFKERKRLFALARSGWSDYKTAAISGGGGIFERRAKSIQLSPEMKKMFAVTADKVTPNELIKMILRLDVDLLWFGGIGTYVKAGRESHADTGDRGNDAIRVDATEVRARIVGEGANLGLTQNARVEYALNGGRLNADSIDNSAGVDCSDHEVNIKILLDRVVADGKLSKKARNALLAKMTDEVGALVLRDNYLQTQAITLVQTQGTEILDHQMRLMRMLEKAGRLNRTVEYLPDDETLNERALVGKGLTRPEVSVLMSYSKIWLYDELLASDVPEDKYLADDLVRYFPTPLQGAYANDIAKHRLRREIIATRVTNSMINRVGGTFVTQLMEKTGMPAADIARAYAITREVFALREIWEKIETLDNKVPAHTQTSMLQDINRLTDRVTLWFLRHGVHPLDIAHYVDQFSRGTATLKKGLAGVLPQTYFDDLHKRAQVYIGDGVPKDLALTVAGLVNMVGAPDVVRLAEAHKIDVCKMAKLFYKVGARFRLGRLRAACESLESQSHWQKLAIAALLEELYAHQVALASQVLAMGGADLSKALEIWSVKNKVAIDRTEQLLSELWAGDVNDVSMVAVASRSLRALAESVPA
ncbi:NAD-glutamate dehydrogenase [Varunaivibrio sulfuroxidans]|uniref:Glutamate dehydrogenase (NAD) n=1 Tax=Varunaivibrio sulfuroxidans TaxID=1773489 RepID=A0A4R3JFE3_9PROT|nr:NAD-glutamate dehydrogenase [Varunaivibrio sulfuroxidans]TCS64828.1 glutamate dehydrogenase (NAD) [Varunaivibrio sulfuroxidans]WES29871.1 NAD-glutamate dehydrogenase [Varunaivibrio sulfuroxidans]